MTDKYSADTAKIRALNSSLVSLLRTDPEQEIPADRIQESAGFISDSYQQVLNDGTKLLASATADAYGETLANVEAAYTSWRAVDDAFLDALSLAYNGKTPVQNLQLDSLHQDLKRRVGDPVAALYTRIHSAWREHLDEKPWDAYQVDENAHVDQQDVDKHLNSLVHGDHLDVEDAVCDLTGQHRHLFAAHLEQTDSLDMIEQSLWMRPEIVVMNDYWSGSNVRILDILRRRGSSQATNAFARVQDLFTTNGAETTSDPEGIIAGLRAIYHEDRDAYYRCLILHPDQAVRRYAVNNVDLEGFWKVVTPDVVPCASILSMLERVVGSQDYDDNFKRVFFNTIHRRLLNLTSRSELLYARGIVRIFAQQSFFMEDHYFDKLISVIDYVSAKERRYRVEDGVLDEYVNQLKHEKRAVGSIQSDPPPISNIPPVVLRKLARDGHFWFELASHPMFKIARETVPHINSQDRALRAARNHVINTDVLRSVGKNRALFKTMTAKLALLTNPRTPPTVSLSYIGELSRREVEMLLRKSTVHAELRQYLRERINR